MPIGINNQARRRRARDRSSVQGPDAIFATDLKLWLPVNADSVTEAGTGASQWDDQSGNGHSLVQGTDANRPTYAASDSDFNGHGSLTFNGTSDRLIDASAAIATGGTYVWWAVIKLTTADANPRWLMETQTGRLALASWTGTKWGTFVAAFSPWASSSPDTTAKALVVVFDGSGGTARLYEGGNDRGTIAYLALNISGAFGVGANYVGTANYYSGKIAELGIAADITAANITALRAYLTATYGVAA